MADRTLHPEFRDRHEKSNYPFSDNAILSSVNVEIFTDTFIDASIYAIGGAENAALKSVVIGRNTATLYIGDAANVSRVTGVVDFLNPVSSVPLQDSLGRPAGVLVSDANRLSIFQAWDIGNYQFNNAEFAASVVMPMPEIGVRGFRTEAGELLAGDVWLVGENGVVIREESTNVIRFDFVGDTLFARKLCVDEGMFTTPTFLKTINGQAPDAQGDFKFNIGENSTADTVLRVVPTDGGLKISAVGQIMETARIARD
jgi:hypothetical protein